MVWLIVDRFFFVKIFINDIVLKVVVVFKNVLVIVLLVYINNVMDKVILFNNVYVINFVIVMVGFFCVFVFKYKIKLILIS